MEPRVTTIIPAYNHAEYIEQAINSVLDQDYRNHELIVVDDASSDGTAEVLARFGDHPLVTLVLNAHNRGQSAAFGQGLELATGQFICLLPSDDWILPGRIRCQVDKFAEASPATGIVYGRGLRFFEDSGETIEVDLPLIRGNMLRTFLLEGNTIYPVTPMFRRECFDKVGLDTSLSAEGEAIYLKMSLHYEFDYVDRLVAVMRDHRRNTGKRIHMLYEDNIRYFSEFFDRPDITDEIRALRGRTLARFSRTAGLTFLRDAGDPKMARQALVSAVRHRPSLLLRDWRVGAGILLASVGYSRTTY